jgi:hypothetical protein
MVLAQSSAPLPAGDDLLRPAVVNRNWLAMDRSLGLGAATAFAHVGAAADARDLTWIADGEHTPLGYLLARWSTLWLVVPPGSHQVQLQGDLGSDNGIGWVPPSGFVSGVAPFAVANVVSWRFGAVSDGRAGRLAVAGWDAVWLGYTPNAEVGLTARTRRFFALVGVKAGGNLFWGDALLATAAADGEQRKGQAAPLGGASAVAELGLADGWNLRLAAEGTDTVERLPVPGGRQIVFARAALTLQARHLEVGVATWAFSAGRAPVGNGNGFQPVGPDATALATLGYRR